MKVSITVEHQGKIYEGETELQRKTKKEKQSGSPQKNWYQKGSTTEKLLNLADNGFFDVNRTISDIIGHFKTKDFHFKPGDLTMPLRTLVRRDILLKTKELPDGTKSKHWTYVRHS